MTAPNPWTNRFTHLLDRDEIRRLSLRVPPAFRGLDDLPIETACMKLEGSFKELFVPTEQSVSILQELIGLALAHAESTYSTINKFQNDIYAKKVPLPDISTIICFTGLSGTGKSQIINALRRILNVDTSTYLDLGECRYALVSAWLLCVRERTTVAKLLRLLLGEDATSREEDLPASKKKGRRPKQGGFAAPKHDISKLLDQTRHRALKNGVCIIGADEFQFVTRSESANSLVTAMLMHLAAVGLPFFYTPNFSMCHRLLRRPHEDRQRLLKRRIVLSPEAAQSADWLAIVKAFCAIAPEIFSFNAELLAPILHKWTAGINRLLGNLLVIAYRHARQNVAKSKSVRVEYADLEWAYKSVEFGEDRQDVILLNNYSCSGSRAGMRKDLVCPFELPKTEIAQAKESANAQRIDAIQQVHLRSAMTKDEKETYDRLQKEAQKSTPEAKGNLSKHRGSGPTTIESLLRGEEVFRRGLA